MFFRYELPPGRDKIVSLKPDNFVFFFILSELKKKKKKNVRSKFDGLKYYFID